MYRHLRERRLWLMDHSGSMVETTTSTHDSDVTAMRSWFTKYPAADEASNSARPYTQGQRLSIRDSTSTISKARSTKTYNHTSDNFNKNSHSYNYAIEN